MTHTENIINQLKPALIKCVTEKLSAVTNSDFDIAVAWKNKQDDAVEVVKKLLLEHLTDSKSTSPKSKSTYPDVKIENDEGLFAIDIKAGESEAPR